MKKRVCVSVCDCVSMCFETEQESERKNHQPANTKLPNELVTTLGKTQGPLDYKDYTAKQTAAKRAVHSA